MTQKTPRPLGRSTLEPQKSTADHAGKKRRAAELRWYYGAFEAERQQIRDEASPELLKAIEGLEVIERSPHPKTKDWQAVYDAGLPYVTFAFPPLRWHVEKAWTPRELRMLVAYGIGGTVAQELNYGVLLRFLPDRDWERALPTLQSPVGQETDPVWLEIEYETILFQKLGWRLKQCEHGNHWYIGSYRRQYHCPAHAIAGRMAAYRRLKLGVQDKGT